MEPVLLLHGTEAERPLAIVLIGGLITTIFTLLVLPTFYLHVHARLSRGEVAAEPS